jgi:hypothetical protein
MDMAWVWLIRAALVMVIFWSCTALALGSHAEEEPS